MNLKSAVAWAVAAALAAPVLAQKAPRSTDDKTASTAASSFAAMDRNNDGYLSRDEIRDVPWSNRFSELDQDNDGRISQSEFEALGKAAAGATGQQEKRK